MAKKDEFWRKYGGKQARRFRKRILLDLNPVFAIIFSADSRLAPFPTSLSLKRYK
ncbi:MAG: hypothetical protein GY731_10310 [Gammaproteobacteria bacterium]|nr:hypothetical protein [Gammaproteobacteria bacterium]